MGPRRSLEKFYFVARASVHFCISMKVLSCAQPLHILFGTRQKCVADKAHVCPNEMCHNERSISQYVNTRRRVGIKPMFAVSLGWLTWLQKRCVQRGKRTRKALICEGGSLKAHDCLRQLIH